MDYHYLKAVGNQKRKVSYVMDWIVILQNAIWQRERTEYYKRSVQVTLMIFLEQNCPEGSVCLGFKLSIST